MTEATTEEQLGRVPLLSDLWNPILVKEVRQALRGKYFKVCFWFTLFAVTLVSTVTTVFFLEAGQGSDLDFGPSYFIGIYFCLALAVLVLVPFSAFNAMGAEWEENTYDLLIISNLRPRAIVLGKLLSASIQTLLFYSAFTPFLVFSSLLRGSDLYAVLVVLGVTLLLSILLTVLSIGASTISRVRFARIVLMVAVIVALLQVLFPAMAVAAEVTQNPGRLRDPGTWDFLLGAFLVATIVALYAFTTACNLIAHPEENRSTGVRVLTSCALLVTFGWMASQYPWGEPLAIGAIVLLLLLLVPSLFLVTEPEPLGRRVAPRVPRRRVLALLCAPWLPGGGRGMLLFLLHLVLIVGASALMLWSARSAPPAGAQVPGLAGVVAIALYAFIYLALPSGLLAPFVGRPMMRAAARAVVPFLAMTFAFIPALLGFFLDDSGLQRMRHPGNPFHLVERSWRAGVLDMAPVWLLVIGMAGLSLLFNLPRMLRSLREVQAASAARAQRDALLARERSAPETADALAES